MSHFPPPLVQNVHSDIHGGLNNWLEARCPLAAYGCGFAFRRLYPGITVYFPILVLLIRIRIDLALLDPDPRRIRIQEQLTKSYNKHDL